ncbi:MAG TPA: sulfatase [Thermoanaerobaculia bacterium]|nr:sulfatase [Thermoanaerobaculia bacterium]
MRKLLIVGTAVLALAGCDGASERRAESWQRTDLWAEQPSEGGGVVRRDAPLGPEEVRDPKALPPSGRRLVESLPAAAIHALEQAAGSRAGWRVELGSAPYLSFIPLPCPCTYRVTVRDRSGDTQELYAKPAEPPGHSAPPAVSVDLGAYAGSAVELFLEVQGPATARALWGSPAIYSRHGEARPRRDEKRPNILLLGIDTLRADALGAYGRNPSVTPALDRLAAESDVWLQTTSCFNVTNPSFTSLLTGLYGKNHGIYDFDHRLAPEHTTLAEVFSGLGYDTQAVLSIDHLADARSGLGQGFDKVQVASDQFAAELVVDTAMDWIAGRERPFFLWLHLFDPHTPHTPPRPFATGYRPETASGLTPPERWTPFRRPGAVGPYRNPILGGHADLYAGEVAYLDRQIDRLLDFLRSRRLLDNTIVVLIADHGENLEDHGVSYRHAGLWDTVLHVPLMIRWPGERREGRRLAGLVQNIDVFPTLLAAVGAPAYPSDGIDLRQITGEGRNGRRVVFAEHTGLLGAMVRTRRHKYWWSRGNRFVPDGAYLYDLERDPAEAANLAGSGLPVERELTALLERWMARHGAGPAQKEAQSEEELERLRALGYL